MSTETIEVTDVIDPRLAAALSASNYRLTLNLQRENAKLKLLHRLQYAENGGIFKVTPDLISFIAAIKAERSSAVILDMNDNPIKIESLEDFFENILDVHQESMNDYFNEHENFKKLRNTEKVVGW